MRKQNKKLKVIFEDIGIGFFYISFIFILKSIVERYFTLVVEVILANISFLFLGYAVKEIVRWVK